MRILVFCFSRNEIEEKYLESRDVGQREMVWGRRGGAGVEWFGGQDQRRRGHEASELAFTHSKPREMWTHTPPLSPAYHHATTVEAPEAKCVRPQR